MSTEYVERLEERRREKDDFLAEHPQSPIPPERRDTFDGLSYFEPDPEYRIEATVSVPADPDPIELSVPGRNPVRYLRTMAFRFELDGDEHSLSGYGREDDEGPIFVPFRDKTTGQETYHRGRYMELEPDEQLTDGDVVTIDFNLAFNPFCAYSEVFACPLPPEENWLVTTVYAGEKAFTFE